MLRFPSLSSPLEMKSLPPEMMNLPLVAKELPLEMREVEKMQQRLVVREVREQEVILMLMMKVVQELEAVAGRQGAKVW